MLYWELFAQKEIYIKIRKDGIKGKAKEKLGEIYLLGYDKINLKFSPILDKMISIRYNRIGTQINDNSQKVKGN